jgi:hypothetical protein
MKNYYIILGCLFIAWHTSAQTTMKDVKHSGDKINICGKISAAKSPEASAAKSTVITVSNTGNVSPVNVVIKLEDRKNFSYKPEEYLYSKNVCVTGTTVDNNGKTEVIVRRPEDIKVEDTGGSAEIRPFDFDGLNRFLQDDKI